MRVFWIEWIRNIFKKETNPNEELKPMKCIKIGEHLPFNEMGEKQLSREERAKIRDYKH